MWRSPPGTAQHCWAHGDILIVVGVKKVTPFYSGEKGKRKKVKLMMMLVWESSNNSKWGIWAVVDKTLPSLLATHTHTQSETSGAHSPTM
jgi:hypothetical protein